MKFLDTLSVNDNNFSLVMEFSMYCIEKVKIQNLFFLICINFILVSCSKITKYLKKSHEPRIQQSRRIF
jgi:hypothetical protein